MKSIIIPTSKEITTYSALKDESLPIGSIATVELKNGDSVDFILVEKNVYGATNVFINADCYSELPMYDKYTMNVCYAKSDRIKQLNSLLDLFPDELRDIILEREIKQKVNGKNYSVTAKLWTPSTTEIVGENINPCDIDDVHFSYFDNEKSRVAECGEHGTWFYALRSPTPTASTGFGTCGINGGLGSNYATATNGVRFGFLV